MDANQIMASAFLDELEKIVKFPLRGAPVDPYGDVKYIEAVMGYERMTRTEVPDEDAGKGYAYFSRTGRLPTRYFPVKKSTGIKKIAAGPHMVEADDVFQGLYMPRQELDKQLKRLPETEAILRKNHPEIFRDPTKDVVFHPSRNALRTMGIPEENIEMTYKGARRHELTHWKRKRAGKFHFTGKPGLLNVLRAHREEAIAHLKTAPRSAPPEVHERMAAAIVPAVRSSVASLYRGRTGEAAMGGAFGKVLKALRMVR